MTGSCPAPKAQSSQTEWDANNDLGEAQCKRRAHADCTSVTSGMRSNRTWWPRRHSCNCVATKSSCPSGVPNTRMPNRSMGNPEPRHTNASGSVTHAIRSSVSKNPGLTPPEFHTWVLPSFMRMREWTHNSRCTVHTRPAIDQGLGSQRTDRRETPTTFLYRPENPGWQRVQYADPMGIIGSPCSPPSPCSMRWTCPSSSSQR